MKLTRREFLKGLCKVGIIAPIVPTTIWFTRDEGEEREGFEPDVIIDTVYYAVSNDGMGSFLSFDDDGWTIDFS